MVYVSEQLLFDFSSPGDCCGWTSVDDVVMGGCSHSTVSFVSGALVFSGKLSLESGGGFASIRSPLRHFDLSSGTAVILRVTGDGKTYKLGLRSSEAFDAPVYQALFTAPADRASEIFIPFYEFVPRYHGRELREAPPFDPRQIRSIGLLIAEKQAGSFCLKIDSIAFR